MQRRTLLKVGAVNGAGLGFIGSGAALLYKPGWHAGRLTDAPTSIGANPQLSVYGLTNRLATRQAMRLGGA